MLKNFSIIIFSLSLIYVFFNKQQTHLPQKVLSGPSYSSVFTNAYLLGNKTKLSNHSKKAHRLLGWAHFLTPSGFHLSALLLFFRKFINRKRKVPFSLFMLFIILVCKYFNLFYSIQRIALFYLLRSLFPKKPTTNTLLITLIMDFLMGGFHKSPLSFLLSFLFLYLFCLKKESPAFPFWRTLLLCQAFIQVLFENSFNPISLFIGSLLSPTFYLLYGLSIIDLIGVIPSNLWNLFDLIFLHLFHFLKNLPSFSFNEFPFLLFIYFPIHFLGIFYFLIPTNIYNFDSSKIHQNIFNSPAPKAYLSISDKKSYILTRHENNLICRSRLKYKGWSTHCSLKSH